MRVLVTGAASGIGRAVACRLAAAGAEMYLTDLREGPLEAVAETIRANGGTVALAMAADVADHAAVQALADRIHADLDALDAVLNVAGIATWGTVESLTHDHWRTVIEVNLMGPIHVIESFVPPMIQAGRGGHLVNVSSAAGLLGLPWHAPYSASKFGLRGISEVLRFDLARHRIAVTLVCPGGVDTPLADTVQVAGIDVGSPVFQTFLARFRRHAVSPANAAVSIVTGMLDRRYLVFTSNDIRLLHLVQRYVPPVYALLMHLANRVASRVAAWTKPTGTEA